MNIETIQHGSSIASSVSRAQNPSKTRQSASTGMNPANLSGQNSSETSASSGSQDRSMKLEDAIGRLKNFVAESKNADINFSIDQSSGVQVVKVVDRKTQETIRQIPSEEAINLAMALDKLQGLFVREQA